MLLWKISREKTGRNYLTKMAKTWFMNFKQNPLFYYKNEYLLTIPNILSFYRLFSFPVLLAIALFGYRQLFSVLFIINLITDILDGFIARRFNLKTNIGSRIDSLADVGSYILAAIGIYLFKWYLFQPYMPSFLIFLAFVFATDIFSLIKFGKFTCLHLYSVKIGGYIQGFFFFLIFTYGFFPIYYYFMITWGILAFIENLTVQILIREMQTDMKGLYWIMKECNSGKNIL